MFLKENDPVRKLALTDDSVFYRVTDRQFVANSMISGNPKSTATIRNHLALQDHPERQRIEEDIKWPGQTDEARQGLREILQVAATMQADELPDPSLNVMYGSNARSGALEYAEPYDKLCSMTLGDLRRAGGGDVFYDIRPVKKDRDSIPLIVTLPAGKSIPVTTQPADEDDSSQSVESSTDRQLELQEHAAAVKPAR
jgi:hypothetical protein